MAYYRLSQVLKMRREAMEHSRFDYGAEGPSFMTVFRLEKGNRIKENTYRKLSRAMGEEESTRQGIVNTTDIRVLWLMNEISNSFLKKDYEKVEALIVQLEKDLDCTVKRNIQYLEYVKAKLQYGRGEITDKKYETVMKNCINYGTMDFERMIEKSWPFHEQECQVLLEMIGTVRKKGEYEQEKYLLEQLQKDLESGYLEEEYYTAYLTWVRIHISDVLGNLGYHREAIAMAEETLRQCEDRREIRYLAEIYYDIFWNYYMIKKKETLTEQEKARCKECLINAYYINKAWYQPKELYERKLRECYPEELM